MKVHLIKKQSIENYVKANAQSKSGFEEWLAKLKYADWAEPLHIVSTFSSADVLGQGTQRVVFNIGGNKYRLICEYVFGIKNVHLYVCWMGTHAEYTKLCGEGRQYSINKF